HFLEKRIARFQTKGYVYFRNKLLRKLFIFRQRFSKNPCLTYLRYTLIIINRCGGVDFLCLLCFLHYAGLLKSENRHHRFEKVYKLFAIECIKRQVSILLSNSNSCKVVNTLSDVVINRPTSDNVT